MSMSLPPDYLDNTEHHSLATALATLIGNLRQRQLDIATGFFEPGAWRLLQRAFSELEALRLLLGEAPEIGGPGDDSLDLRQVQRQRLQVTARAARGDRRTGGPNDRFVRVERCAG